MDAIETSEADLLLRDASSGDTEEEALSAGQYAWVRRRAEQHGMSPIQFVEHVLTRLRRAEAIRKQAEQSDTFEQVTDELTLLISDDVVDANAATGATTEVATAEVKGAAKPPRTTRSLFDGDMEARDN